MDPSNSSALPAAQTETRAADANTAVNPPQPSAAPPVNAEPQPRRVGTFTMGIALIASGIVLCVSLFFPQYDIISLCRFAPLFLVLLGVEVLIAGAHNRPLRYDFLSMILCAVLIFAAMFATSIALWMQFSIRYGYIG